VTPGDGFVGTPHGRLFVRVWSADHGDPGRAPIVLLHDSLGCVELWRDFPGLLSAATGRVVVAYDRLGFGKSDPHPATLGFDFVSAEAGTGLTAIAAELGLARMVLFGHSVGGAMAVAAGAIFTERIQAVVTESAQAFVEERTVAAIADARTFFRSPEQLARLGRYHGAKARWVLDAWTETWLAPEFAGWTLDAELRRLRCPVLVIHGRNDEFGSEAFPRRIAGLPPTPGEMVMVDDCGHVPHREKPELVLDTVAAFLARR
jgi:pimeloyl-ACP methyl ester carboxylesterase